MKIKKENIVDLISGFDTILRKMDQGQKNAKSTIQGVDPVHKKSVQNLLDYLAFRSFDVRRMQKQLKNLGMTRFANAEQHIRASVLTVRSLLGFVIGEEPSEALQKQWSIKKVGKILDKKNKILFGERFHRRRGRIMVTLPSEAADNPDLVKKMMEHGLDIARINCAHDNQDVWSKMIANIRRASKELDRPIKIAMDLAGPKIRTGEIVKGPKVLRCKPTKDSMGTVTKPARMTLVPESEGFLGAQTVPIKSKKLNSILMGDVMTLVDGRGKHRKITVVEIEHNRIVVESDQTVYFVPGTVLIKSTDILEEYVVGDIPQLEQVILLKEGDELWVTKTGIGHPSRTDDNGQLVQPASISCQVPEVFDYIKPGHGIFFDDGKIGGIIIEVGKENFKVAITLAKSNGSKLRALKGINFPDSRFGFSGLTEKDREDLPFVVRNADIINFSFVNRPEDVAELYEELSLLDTPVQMGIICKIETQLGYENLIPILLAAMKSKNIGIMIARGDLAIETGWHNLGKIQDEILSLCGAAHIPVVWATQVLEGLAKKGLPSRSEITDATAALKAECIMLNKGKYILDAITLLDSILSKMEPSQNKKEPMLAKLERSHPK